MPHFDWSITPVSIIAVVTLIVGGLFAWRDHEWRVKNLEDWKAAHEHSTAKALENIAYLRNIAGRLEEMVKGQNRRLEIIETTVTRPRAH